MKVLWEQQQQKKNQLDPMIQHNPAHTWCVSYSGI